MEINYRNIDKNKYEQWLIDNGFILYDTGITGTRYYRKKIKDNIFEFVVPSCVYDCRNPIMYNNWIEFINLVAKDLMLIFTESETKKIIESWYFEHSMQEGK